MIYFAIKPKLEGVLGRIFTIGPKIPLEKKVNVRSWEIGRLRFGIVTEYRGE